MSPAASGLAPDLISQTTLTWAQQTQLATSTAIRDRKNADNQRIFDSAVADFNAGMASGVKMQLNLPIAPFRYVLTTPDANGEVFYEQSTTQRLVPTVPIATVNNATLTLPDNPPGTMVLGILIPGTDGIYQALKGDTCAEGTVKIIPGPDGALLKLRKHGTPWGGYWERIG